MAYSYDRRAHVSDESRWVDRRATQSVLTYMKSGNVDESTPESPAEQKNDPIAFNTELAKLMQKLKKDAGASSISQNYRGTGSQAHRRQLWVRFKSGAVIDLWLEESKVGLGGIVKNGVPGKPKGLVKEVAYGNKTPEQVYKEVAGHLKEWANP